MPKNGQSLVKPLGVATPELESVGVLVPALTGPLTPPFAGVRPAGILSAPTPVV
jgi:hypothetical protein